jgi:hypothetical protein
MEWNRVLFKKIGKKKKMKKKKKKVENEEVERMVRTEERRN